MIRGPRGRANDESARCQRPACAEVKQRRWEPGACDANCRAKFRMTPEAIAPTRMLGDANGEGGQG
eukprot:15363692-Alexandrium_andersonii.AAC.1